MSLKILFERDEVREHLKNLACEVATKISDNPRAFMKDFSTTSKGTASQTHSDFANYLSMEMNATHAPINENAGMEAHEITEVIVVYDVILGKEFYQETQEIKDARPDAWVFPAVLYAKDKKREENDPDLVVGEWLPADRRYTFAFGGGEMNSVPFVCYQEK